jgi:hypothetical protein
VNSKIAAGFIALILFAWNQELEGSTSQGKGTHRASDRGQADANLYLARSATFRAGRR